MLAVSETICGIWKFRNKMSFGKNVGNMKIGDTIINILVYREWCTYPGKYY